MTEIDEVLGRWFCSLRARKNVLNVAIGDKYANGIKTGKRAIVVYVTRKEDAKMLGADLVPKQIDGIDTDVVVFDPKDFKIGDTTASRLPPNVQRRIAGGVRK